MEIAQQIAAARSALGAIAKDLLTSESVRCVARQSPDHPFTPRMATSHLEQLIAMAAWMSTSLSHLRTRAIL